MIPAQHRRLIGWGAMALVAGMPFHAFFAIWAGHLLGHQAWWQSWKEILIVLLGLVALDGLRRKPAAIKQLYTPVNIAIIAFILVASVTTLIVKPPALPAWFGIKTDFEFLAAFLLFQLIGEGVYKRKGAKILLATTAVVSLLAIVQSTILPPQWLARFGYSIATINPHQLVNGLTRAFSTLGGPNQLGAFLILPIAITTKLLFQRRQKWQWAAMLALNIAALYFTFSRSAWLGVAAAMLIVTWFEITGSRRRIAIGILILMVAAGLYSYAQMNGSLLRHSAASDPAHLQAVRSGVTEVVKYPLGRGLGSAGPASFHSASGDIPENYYLQIAIETGILGLVLFIAIQIALFMQLWQWRSEAGLAGPLLASLVGISVVNLFLHGWADSSTALTYWTLAALTIGGAKDVKAN